MDRVTLMSTMVQAFGRHETNMIIKTMELDAAAGLMHWIKTLED